MPEFEYKCGDCGAVSQFYRREDASICPICGSRKLTRVFSPPNILRSKSEAGKGALCCGRDSRPDSCTPGSCCHS